MLDASVLAALYVDDPATERSEAALTGVQADQLRAPDFVLLEVANLLWKRVRREELQAQDAMTAIADLSAASIQFHPIGSLAAQSLALALSHRFTAYDATYVALATRVGGVVLTNDGGMRQRGIEAGLPVITPSRLYDDLASDKDDSERLHLRLAFGLRDTRERNGQRVDRLVRCLAISAVALVIRLPAGRGRSRYCEVPMSSKPNSAPAPRPEPSTLPSQGIPAVSPSVFIPEKRGANSPGQS